MDWTVAFAGTGEVASETFEPLLDDWLPMEGVSLLFPKVARNNRTLKGVLAWAEKEELEVEQGVEVFDLLVAAQSLGDQVYLVLAWDDTDESQKLLERALEAKIPVKDLTRALDDLEFEDEPEDDEAVQPGPVEPEEPAVEEPAESESDQKIEQADKIIKAQIDGPATIHPAGGSLDAAIQPGPEWVGSFLEDWVRRLARDEIAKALAVPEKKSVRALVDENDNYRLAKKGRPKKGERPIQLTPTEAAEIAERQPSFAWELADEEYENE